jgi:O-antigen/teichoic acid export membrane protein
MGIVVRQSLKASFVSYVGVGLGLVNNLFVSTKFLTPEQLSITRLLLENSLVFASFVHLGTPFILDKFFVHFKNQEKKHHGFLGFLLLLCLIGVGIFAFLYVLFKDWIADYFEEKSPAILDYHFLSIPLTAFWVFLIIFEAYSRNHARIAIPAFIREVFLKASNIILILIYSLGWLNFDYLVYAIVLLYGFAVIFLMFYIKNLGKLFLHIGWGIFRGGNLKPMLVYGSVLVLGGLGENIFNFVDRVMLAGKEGLQETAIFILASFIVTTIQIPKKTLSQISIPLLSEALQTKNYEKLKEIYHKVALHQLMGGLFVFLGVWCCIDELFAIIPKGQIYAEGKWVVFVLGATTLFNLAAGLKGETIMYSDNYRFSSIFVFIFAILNIFLNYWLIDLYKLEGAAYATTIASVLYISTQVTFVYIKFKILPYQWKQLYVVMFSIVLGGFIKWIFPEGQGFWSHIVLMMAKALMITALYIGFLLMFRISPELNQLYDWFLKKIFKKQG